MISRMWQVISSWLGIGTVQPKPLIKRIHRKQRFVLIQDPYQIGKNKSDRQSKATQYPKNAEEVMNMYRLTFKDQQNKQALQKIKQNDDFIFSMIQMDNVLKQIHQTSQSILKDSIKIDKTINSILTKLATIDRSTQKQRENYTRYLTLVVNPLETKYTGERKDYPEISYEQFRQVLEIWQIPEREGQGLVPGYEYLRFNHLRLLEPGRWLNDEIITEYIGFINAKLTEKEGNSYIVFNSLKVTSLFDKTDYKKLQKVLQRQKVSRTSKLLLAIHKTNHWLFMLMQNSSLSIFDSMLINNDQSYINFPLIGKIAKFAQYYYQSPPAIERVLSFPQQRNGSDCGMMMLCGIKDVVRGHGWGFGQADMGYRRVLVTRELLDRRIVGF